MRIQRSVVSDSRLRALAQISKAIHQIEMAGDLDTDLLVHQIRKRIKKIRALVRLARPAVGKKAATGVDRRLRDAARPLSQVRDAAALLATLDRLEARSIGLVAPEPFEAARAALEAHKAKLTQVALADGQALAHARKLLRDVKRRVEAWEVEERPNRPFDGIGRAYRSGRDAFRIVQDDPSTEHLHDLRKRSKALGYQLSLLEKHNHSPTPLRVRLLAGLLAVELGEWHDLELLHAFLQAQPSCRPILKVLGLRRLDLKQAAIQRAGVIFQVRPKAFERGLKSVIRR